MGRVRHARYGIAAQAGLKLCSLRVRSRREPLLGRRQLAEEREQWDLFAAAVQRILAEN